MDGISMYVTCSPDDKVHTDNVVGFASATIKHHVSPGLTPDELSMLVQHPVVSTDTLSFLQHYIKYNACNPLIVCLWLNSCTTNASCVAILQQN